MKKDKERLVSFIEGAGFEIEEQNTDKMINVDGSVSRGICVIARKTWKCFPDTHNM